PKLFQTQVECARSARGCPLITTLPPSRADRSGPVPLRFLHFRCGGRARTLEEKVRGHASNLAVRTAPRRISETFHRWSALRAAIGPTARALRRPQARAQKNPPRREPRRGP